MIDLIAAVAFGALAVMAALSVLAPRPDGEPKENPR